jgi:hypothetical protein
MRGYGDADFASSLLIADNCIRSQFKPHDVKGQSVWNSDRPDAARD